MALCHLLGMRELGLTEGADRLWIKIYPPLLSIFTHLRHFGALSQTLISDTFIYEPSSFMQFPPKLRHRRTF